MQEEGRIMNTNRSPILVLLTSTLLFGQLAASELGAKATLKRYVITNSGAVGDGQAVNTRAIQALIDRISADGGGVLVVPKGTFMSGALFFKKGVDLVVEKDGVLKGTVNPDDYPQIRTRWEGIEREWTCAFLNFDNMTNVTMTGEGMIDGSGDLWMQRLAAAAGWRHQPANFANHPAGGTGRRPDCRGHQRCLCWRGTAPGPATDDLFHQLP